MSNKSTHHNKHGCCILIRIQFVSCLFHLFLCVAFRLAPRLSPFSPFVLLGLFGSCCSSLLPPLPLSAPRCRLLLSLFSRCCRCVCGGQQRRASEASPGLSAARFADWPADLLCASTGRPPLHSPLRSPLTRCAATQQKRSPSNCTGQKRTTAGSVIGECDAMRCDAMVGRMGETTDAALSACLPLSASDSLSHRPLPLIPFCCCHGRA